MSLSVVLITLNEEHNISPCLDTVAWADEIVVVDGGSQDKTVELAKQKGAVVFEIPFTDFASQKNEALSRASHDWILMLDADERITKELEEEIKSIVASNHGDAVYAIHRQTYFFGKHLRFSGTREDYPVRLVPLGKVKMEQPVHEEVVSALPVKRLKHEMIHYSTRDRQHYEEKLNRYLPYEQEVLKARNVRLGFVKAWVRAIGKFMHLYFVLLGFLDGWAGLQYASLSSYYVHQKYRRELS